MTKNINNEIPESIKSYKIEKETYKLLNTVLHTATNTEINEKVLIHVFQKEILKNRANEISFMNNQVFLMKILNHKNILKLYEIIETKTHAFIVYEYFNGVKLSDYISKKKKLNEEESMTIFKEILSVLLYIHGMYICDLNLSPNNIIIDNKNNIKICDFRYGHFYSTKEKSKPMFIGDHPYISPELHSKKSYYPELADMWSSGVILYQMLTGNLPFNTKKDLDMIRLIIKGEYSIPNTINQNLRSVIKGLMEKNEEKRFKINDLFNQQYFKDKNITKKLLGQGLNVLIMKYPIDEIALNICTNNLGIQRENLIKYLENNKFTPYTSLFKQIVTKLTSKGIKTINDLVSDKFISYINDNNNYLKEEEQIKSIQSYLKKEEDIRKNAKDVVAILLNNQNEISQGLLDLKKQFENAKKGDKQRKKQKSLDYGKGKRRRTLEIDNDIKKMNKQNAGIKYPSTKTKNVNIKSVKRNTFFTNDIKGLKIGQLNYNYVKKNSKINPVTDDKNEKEEDKAIKEIKEEEEKGKEGNKIDENELSKSESEKSIKSKESNESKKNEEKKEEVVTNNQEPHVEPVEEKKPIPKKEEGPIIKKATLKKNVNQYLSDQKPKKLPVTQLNQKKEFNKNQNEAGKTTTTTKKVEPKVQGFRNIKDLIEANMKKKKFQGKK